MKNLSADPQRFIESCSPDRNNHELLKVDVVIGMGAAVEIFIIGTGSVRSLVHLSICRVEGPTGPQLL